MFQRRVISFTDTSVTRELVNLFRDPLSARSQNEPLPELHVGNGVHITEALATLSNRQQLNVTLAQTRFHYNVDDGRSQARFNQAYMRGRGYNSPVKRRGQDQARSMPAGGRDQSRGYADTRYSALPAPRIWPCPVWSQRPPTARDPGSYLSEQDFADCRSSCRSLWAFRGRSKRCYSPQGAAYIGCSGSAGESRAIEITCSQVRRDQEAGCQSSI